MIASILMGLTQLCFAEGPVVIPDPRVQVAAAAQKQLLPGLKRAGNSIIEIPRQLGQCFRLPLGLLEVLLSPLPDIEFKEGVGDLGSGILAPFKFCIAVCEMPYEVYRGLGDVVKLK
ncbi:MAG: hypothetical protein WCP55_13730 [Lentisphaerota bacterium]